MQRLRHDERGAIAIIVAIVMIMLLGFAALAIDISAMWAEKRQLQNGADAASLAVAQTCAKTPAVCAGGAQSTAESYTASNRNNGAPKDTIVSLTSNSVTVTASDPHDNWFAQVIGGGPDSEVSAKATATWEGPKTLKAEMPLTFSQCTWSKADLTSTTEMTINFYEPPSGETCAGYPNGGFAWADPSPGDCGRVIDVGDGLPSKTGKVEPKECDETYLKSLLNKEILLPIFGSVTGTGSGAKYQVTGYAAFTMTGFKFVHSCYPGKCGGSDEWIKGYFSRFVSLDDPAVIETGGTSAFGVSIVTLTK